MVIEQQYTYQKSSWNEQIQLFLSRACRKLPFEYSDCWLEATENLMLDDDAHVLWHELKADEGQIVAVLPLIHKINTVSRQHKLSSLTSFYSSITGWYCLDAEKDQDLCNLLISSILLNNKWNVLELTPLESSSSLVNSMKFMRYEYLSFFRFNNWFCYPPSSYSEYQQTLPSKLLNTIKRKSKKLDKLTSWETKIVCSEQHLDMVFEHYKKIYVSSWKQVEFDFQFIYFVCREAARRGALRLGLLYVDGQPAAAQIWFVHGEVASIFKLAYDVKYQKLSVGSILSKFMFENVIDKDNVRCIDYGMGDESYKADWMNESRARLGIMVFNLKTFHGFIMWLRHKLFPKIMMR
jgi:hypothetical protein